jgi:competence transcription factor ComK
MLTPITPKEKKSTINPAKIVFTSAELKLVFAVQIIINIKTTSGVILFGKKFGKKDVCAIADKKIIITIKIFCIIISL